MPRQSITWLITDTHFYHDLTKHGRPPNHTELTINNLKRLLAPQDLLIHLGDVILYKYKHLKDILDSIPGTKVLTIGNHDRKSVQWYMWNGFSFAATTFQLDNVMFSHKPTHPLPNDVRLNIHGHWHNDTRYPKPNYYDDRYHLLSLEKSDYKPINLSTIVSPIEQ